MRLTPDGDNQDVEDRRDESGGGSGFGGFGGGGGFGGIHLGIGGTIVLLILSFVFKTNLFSLFSGGGGEAPTHSVSTAPDPARNASEQPEVQFVRDVLRDVQRTWDKLLPQAGGTYRHAKLVLYRDAYPSGCGTAQTATGPFYCPEDEKVYLDMAFFDELRQRFGAPGEFAQAYVIAHEIGHHVQKILGIEGKMRQMEERNPGDRNRLSVGLELQADCFAGVWGNAGEKRNVVDQSDVPAGLRAAAAVGDDRLQKMATGHVSPESFTHGSSAHRVEAFRRGLDSGNPSVCIGN
ncbi:MAG: neutral zinc metallopeptidase [Acidobacteriota bacterium]|nr:neutral zinc metallopeptidase [Acidobacteriota bacterium]